MTNDRYSEEVAELTKQLQTVQIEVGVAVAQLSTMLVGDAENAKRVLEGDDDMVESWIQTTRERNMRVGSGWLDIDEELVEKLVKHAVETAREEYKEEEQ